MAPVYAAADHGTNDSGSGLTLNPVAVAQRALSLVGASTPPAYGNIVTVLSIDGGSKNVMDRGRSANWGCVDKLEPKDRSTLHKQEAKRTHTLAGGKPGLLIHTYLCFFFNRADNRHMRQPN